MLINAGAPEVRIDQQRLTFLLAVNDREMNPRGGLALARRRRSHQKGFRPAVAIWKKDRVPQCADRLFVGIRKTRASTEKCTPDRPFTRGKWQVSAPCLDHRQSSQNFGLKLPLNLIGISQCVVETL